MMQLMDTIIYHSRIKMNPVDVWSSTYIDFGVENNDKDPKFEVGGRVKISEYENIFAKGLTQNWPLKNFRD